MRPELKSVLGQSLDTDGSFFQLFRAAHHLENVAAKWAPGILGKLLPRFFKSDIWRAFQLLHGEMEKALVDEHTISISTIAQCLLTVSTLAKVKVKFSSSWLLASEGLYGSSADDS